MSGQLALANPLLRYALRAGAMYAKPYARVWGKKIIQNFLKSRVFRSGKILAKYRFKQYARKRGRVAPPTPRRFPRQRPTVSLSPYANDTAVYDTLYLMTPLTQLDRGDQPYERRRYYADVTSFKISFHVENTNDYPIVFHLAGIRPKRPNAAGSFSPDDDFFTEVQTGQGGYKGAAFSAASMAGPVKNQAPMWKGNKQIFFHIKRYIAGKDNALAPSCGATVNSLMGDDSSIIERYLPYKRRVMFDNDNLEGMTPFCLVWWWSWTKDHPLVTPSNINVNRMVIIYSKQN